MNKLNILERLNTLDHWKDLSLAIKENLIDKSIYNQYGKESVLFLENDLNPRIYIILSGYVLFYKISHNGNKKILTFLSKGDLLNETSISEKATTAAAKSLENTNLISIDKNDFIKIMNDDLKLASIVFKALTCKLKNSQEDNLSLGVYSVKKRTIYSLLKLSRKFTKRDKDKFIINIPLNQTDISNLVGASRESINRILRDLEEREIISFVNKKIVLNNRSKLLDEFLKNK